MVGGHGLLTEAFAQVPCQAFGQAPGVDENQRGAVSAGQFGEAVVDQIPYIIGHHRRQWHGRHFDVQVTGAGVADVDDLTRAVGAHQKTRYGFDGFLRGRQTDAGQRLAAQSLQTLQAEG